MGLSDDQRAMLRLLAQREEGYEDIAALMGLSVAEVRARVKGALAELDSATPPAPEQPRSAPEPPPVAPAPEPEPAAGPEPTEPAEAEPPAPSPDKPSEPPRPRLSLPSDRRVLAGGAAASLAAIVVIVLLTTGAFGGDGSGAASAGGAASQGGNGGSSRQVTEAVLKPVEGGEASGRALFGRVGEEPVLQVRAKGLDPSPPGQSYTIWLYRSPKLALRIGAVTVGESGGIATQLPIPVELLALLANGAFDQIRVSLTRDAAYRAEVARAEKRNRLPHYTGETALRGRITGPAIDTASTG